MELLQNKDYNFFNIKKKDGSVGPFVLNAPQKKVLEAIQEDLRTKGKTRKIIIKGRQQGISTLIETLLLSYAMSVEAFTGYAMAHDRETANDIFDKIIKFEWQNMNENLRDIYKMKRDNTRQIMFENMNSSSVTVGLSARGGTVDFLHISEAGKMSMNAKLWNEMKEGSLPAAEKAIGIVIESTADGGLGLFYEMVQDSINGKNDYDLVFLCWTESPEYTKQAPDDDSWIEDYKAQAKIYGLYADPMTQFGITKDQFYWYYKKVYELKEAVKVQYPFTLDEAFISKATNKFNLDKIKNLKTKPPLEEHGGLKIFRKPKAGQVYSVGVDVATGLGSDYSGLTIRGFYSEDGMHRVYAQAKVKVSTMETAQMIIKAYNYYSQAGKVYVTVERNSIGQSVNEMIREAIPERYIYSEMTKPTDQDEQVKRRFGFNTSGSNRSGADPWLVDNIANLFHEGKLEIINEDERQEALVFVWNDEKNRYEHQPGKHDDLLLSDMMCIQGFKYIAQYG
jgi:hypothetical protein